MSHPPQFAPLPVQNLSVFPAEAFRVTHGVNLGDPIADASDLILEDVYGLDERAKMQRLAICAGQEDGRFFIAQGSAAGHPGAPLFLDCLTVFMSTHGATEEALVLVEVSPEDGSIVQTYLYPLTPLKAKTGYSLVTIDRDGAHARLAESACISFTRGTHITLAGGRQCLIEDLKVGDQVLTRDSGAQQVRWIGEQTVRASGAFAPIVIAPGTLNNTGALTVSPNHRLFVYQRVDAMGAGQKELLIKARLLVNDTTVTRAEGGFVDYFQILFDKHEIIYAEGIASESLMVDITTRPAIPSSVQGQLPEDTPGDHGARELDEADLVKQNAVDLLRRASTL